MRETYPSMDYDKNLDDVEVTGIRISRGTGLWEVSLRGCRLSSREQSGHILDALGRGFGREIEFRLRADEREGEAPGALALLKTALEDPRERTEDESGLEREEALFNQLLNEKHNETREKKKSSGVIMGRKISSQPAKLRDIRDESRSVVIEGDVFRVNEQKILNAGTQRFDFDVTDHTGSIKAKVFLDAAAQKRMKADWLRTGARYRMKGSVKYDSFTKELVFFPNDITEGMEAERRDEALLKRVELHCHTKLSALDAVTNTDELIGQAMAWGHDAIAITDHGVLQAFPEAMKAARGTGAGGGKGPFKVIYGLEGYLIEGDGSVYMREAKRSRRKSGGLKAEEEPGAGGKAPGELGEAGADNLPSRHIILLAANLTGVKHLYQLVTLSHIDYFYRRPRIPRDELTRLREGLIVGSACESGEVFQLILEGAGDEALEAAASFYDYLEIQPLMNNAYLIRNGKAPDEETLKEMNRRIVALGRRLGKPVAATCDVHFLRPEDEALRRILQAGQGYKDADIQPPLYFRTTEEMLDEFSYLGEEEAFKVVVEATRAIAGQIEALDPIPDKLSTPKLPGAREEVEGMVRDKARALYGDPLPEWISQRLEKEIKSITEYGYADLYYIARRLVKFSNDKGFMVGSRGSVGCSLVAYLADITEVNPLAPHYRCPEPSCRRVIPGDADTYGCGADMPDMACPDCGGQMRKEGFNIPFEVFLGFEGDKTPDIDLNFASGEQQNMAQKYTEELFGRDNVFKAGTVMTIADKTAFGFVRRYHDDRNLPLGDIEAQRLAQGLTGVKRTTSQHPGGIVVLPKGDDIANYTPVQRPADDPDSDFVTTHFDYHAIEGCLVKLDILGHDDPAMMRSLTEMTGKDIGEISFDDPTVLSLFQGPEALGLDAKASGVETGTLGVPEFGTSFVRGMLLDARPVTFSDLIRISGFSHGTDVWLNNIRDILKEGLGTMKEVIGCRDDIMLTLIRAGVDPLHAFRIMERVRRGNGLAREDVEAMEEAGVHKWYIASCQKIKYLFPKAHAVAYVTMAFRIAWFKIHEPLAFYAATFSVRAGLDGSIAAGGMAMIEEAMADIREKRDRRDASGTDEDHYTSLELAREMLLRGYDFAPVSLDKSDAGRFLPEEGKLRLPFSSLPNLGLTAALNITEGRREKPYRSVEDLRSRGKIGQALVAILRGHGALEGLPESDQQTMF